FWFSSCRSQRNSTLFPYTTLFRSSRLLAQPIYRDAVLFGKFLGGLLVIAIALVTLWLMMVGLGILFLGLPPSGADIVRGVVWLAVTVAYAGVWLALAITFSTLVRSPATSALAALAVWLIFTVFWSMIAPLVAGLIAPIDPFDPMSVVNRFEWQQLIARLSPQTLYGEVTGLLLDPAARSVGPVSAYPPRGAVIGAPLPTMQSLLIVRPPLAGLIAAMLLLFPLAYVVVQRQEGRA